MNFLNPAISLPNNATIAVIKGTTTVDKIKEQYPDWNLKIKDDYCNSKEIVKALENDKNIDSYASDEIILKGLLKNHNILRENFTLISPLLWPCY